MFPCSGREWSSFDSTMLDWTDLKNEGLAEYCQV